MKKRIALIIAVIMLIGLLSACGSSSDDSKSNSNPDTTEADSQADTEADTQADTQADTEGTADKVYKIGVIQYVQHEALDSSYNGFIKALDDAGIKYEVDLQNASGEQSACDTISEKLVNDGNDLILAIATPAAQAVAGKTEEIPILVTAVTDPESAGLVASNDAPGGNVSGTSDLTPVKEQIELLAKLLPEAKTVGILYCSAEENSVFQAEIAKKECEANNLAYEVFTVSSTNEVQTVVESMVGKVDAIYTPTDNMIASAMATVSMIATDNKIPIICGEGNMVVNGGLATYGIDYYNLGIKTGEMAVKILKGEADTATTPIEYLDSEECELTINQSVLEELEIALPDEFQDAEFIVD